MSLIVGIDAGGTKLAAAIVETRTGRMLEVHEVPTDRYRGGAAVLQDCVDLAKGLAAQRAVTAIGIGVPELVSLDGQIQSAASWDWRDGEWRMALAAIAPVYVESDASSCPRRGPSRCR